MKIIVLENGRTYTWNQFKMLNDAEVTGTEEEGMIHHKTYAVTEVIDVDEKLGKLINGVIVSAKLEDVECNDDSKIDWNKCSA